MHIIIDCKRSGECFLEQLIKYVIVLYYTSRCENENNFLVVLKFLSGVILKKY